MTLTKENKKILHRYNQLLLAVVGGDGISAVIEIYDGMDWNQIFDELYFHKLGEFGENNNIYPEDEGYNILIGFITNYLIDNQMEFNDSLGCGECNGNGTININYNPFESKFEIILDITVRGEESHEHMYTFDELKNQPTGQWGQRYEELKKLGDSTFIEKMKNDYGNTLEITYDGGGDSGQINDEGYTKTSTVNINSDIEYIGYEIIDIRYSGWENNEGGDGRIVFDFENQLVNIYHNYYVEHSEPEHVGEIKLV